MGIEGLQSFMERNNSLFERVSLPEIAKQYRNETNKDPVMLVDISSCVCHLASSDENIAGALGEIKVFLNNFDTFLSNCFDLGIKVKIYADGMKPEEKKRIWFDRMVIYIRDLEKFYRNKFFVKASDASIFNGIINVLQDVAHAHCRTSHHCEFQRALYEADDDIIHYAKTCECFAILTNDSDFIVVEGARYCLTLKYIDLQTMTMYNYNRANLAKNLEINPSQLIILGSLCYDMKDYQNFVQSNKVDFKTKFFQVAKLVKNISVEEILKNPHELTGKLKLNLHEVIKLKNRLNFLLGNGALKGIRLTKDSSWNNILFLAEEKHKEGLLSRLFLSVITQKVSYFSTGFGDIFKPGIVVGLKPLRQKVYGIIFFECPFLDVAVTEYFITYNKKSRKSVITTSKVSFLRRFHPGLIELWTFDYTYRTVRLKVFCQVLNEKLTVGDILPKDVPPALLYPIYAAFLLLWELEMNVKPLEIDILLYHSALVYLSSAESIKNCPLNFNPDALDLTQTFIGTINFLYFLNSLCGEPFSICEYDVVNYFDGKILQYVYGRLYGKSSETVNWSPEVVDLFDRLKTTLYRLGRLCEFV